jgi:NTE family protein
MRLRTYIVILLATVFHFSSAQNIKIDRQVFVIRPEFEDAPAGSAHLIPYHHVRRPRVALVLSGGGARGVAAIGVLRVLKKNDIPIDMIIGTSMGSVLGGLYAMGYSADQLQRMVDTTDWEDLLSYTDEARRREMFLDQKLARDKSVLVLRFRGFSPVIPEAFSSGQRLTSYLNLLTLQGIYKPEPDFNALRIPFRAVTTDLVTGKRIVIDHGDMTETLRASLAVPLLFSSVRRDTLQLLDGGLVDNLPVDVALSESADIVVAVDMVSPLRPRNKLNAPWEIADQITTIMMQEAIRISRQKANLVITPRIGDHLSSDFTGLDSLIALGEEAAAESVCKLKKMIYDGFYREYKADTGLVFRHVRCISNDKLSAPFRDSLRHYEKLGKVPGIDLQKLVNDIYSVGDCRSVECRIERSGDSSVISVMTELNPVLKRVTVSGNTLFSSDTLSSVFRPLLDRPFNARLFSLSLENLISIYRNSKYSLARVAQMRFDSVSGTAGIVIDEGRVFRTDVRGTSKTRDWVVRRELPWKNNDILTGPEIEKSISNLYGTSLFDQVRLSVRHEGDSSKLNIVTVNARERSTELIRFGLRIDNERNIQPSIDARDENLLGAGAEFGLFAGGGTRNQSYIAELKATRIFNSYLTFSLKGYSTVRDLNSYGRLPSNVMEKFGPDRIGEYREIRNGATASFGMQLERLGSVAVDGRLEKHQILNTVNTTITNQEYNISSIRFGLNVDTQDKLPYPTDGIVLCFYYESALVKLIDAVGFTKMYFSYDNYISLAKHHVFHPRLAAGIADETLPFSENFSLGGQQSFFGYREDNARGRQLLAIDLEYQWELPFSIFFDTFLKLRYDFGSVWESADEMRLEDFNHGFGMTIGLDTPIGPAEFSLGRSLSIRKDLPGKPYDFGPFLVYFSIGVPINGVVRN